MLLGASKLPIEKLEDTLNDYGQEGWGLEFMVIESHRCMLIWTPGSADRHLVADSRLMRRKRSASGGPFL